MKNQIINTQNCIKVRQHHVGDTFEHCKLILKVCESDTCEGCFFWISEEQTCSDGFPSDVSYLEPCSPTVRTDDKSVIFVKVGEVKDNE